MPNQRFRNLGAERREAILASAAAEFAEHGYAAASVNRVIARAGTSKGSLYYYFENKADLLATVLDEALGRVMAELRWPAPAELTADSFWDRLREMTRASVRFLDADTWPVRVLRSLYRLREEAAARAATSGLTDRTRELVGGFVRRGLELGVVRSDLPVELLIELYMGADEAGDRWMFREWGRLTERERAALMDARIDIVRDMLDASHAGWER